MLVRSLHLARSSALRSAWAGAPRTFATSAVRNADPVQDMYLRHLREYKPTPVKASDAEGQVHKFTPPKAPTSPEEADLAGQLSQYESQSVEIEGQASSSEEETQHKRSWFEEEDYEKQDKEAAAAH